MKKIVTLLMLLATSASALMAQNLTVKGSVYDYDSGEALFPAAVQVIQVAGKDSTFITGVTTEEDGSFVIPNLKAGNYVLRASYVAYENTDKNFSLKSDTRETNLGKITLRSDNTLPEVAVNAVVAKVQMINDTVMYNSAVYKLPEGS